MSVYGITGYSGSGKSTVAKDLQKILSQANRNICIIDVDKIIGYCLKQYATDKGYQLYKQDIVYPDGNYKNRIIFEDVEKGIELFKFAWKFILSELFEVIDKNEKQKIDTILDWDILATVPNLCDQTVFVDSEQNLRHKRLEIRLDHGCLKYVALKRDISRDALLAEFITKPFIPNAIIDNNGTEAKRIAQVENFAKGLK